VIGSDIKFIGFVITTYSNIYPSTSQNL